MTLIAQASSDQLAQLVDPSFASGPGNSTILSPPRTEAISEVTLRAFAAVPFFTVTSLLKLFATLKHSRR